MSEPQPGDYVLATKYHDGDPCDHFFVGFVSEVSRKPNGVRFMIVDSEGRNQRANGFRRAERITEEEGRELIAMFPEIGDKPGPSLWDHLERIRMEKMSEEPTVEAIPMGYDPQWAASQIRALADAVERGRVISFSFNFKPKSLSELVTIAGVEIPFHQDAGQADISVQWLTGTGSVVTGLKAVPIDSVEIKPNGTAWKKDSE